MSSTERVIAISQKIIECRKALSKLEEELQSLIKNSKYSVNPNEYGQTCQEICLNILKFAYPKSINFFQLRNMIKGYANGTISSRLSTLKKLNKIESLPDSTYRWIKVSSNGTSNHHEIDKS